MLPIGLQKVLLFIMLIVNLHCKQYFRCQCFKRQESGEFEDLTLTNQYQEFLDKEMDNLSSSDSESDQSIASVCTILSESEDEFDFEAFDDNGFM